MVAAITNAIDLYHINNKDIDITGDIIILIIFKLLAKTNFS